MKNEKPIKEYFTISKNHKILKYFNSPAIKTTQGFKVSILNKYRQVEKGINRLNELIEIPEEEWVFNREEFTTWMREE